jgi:HEAT repeat protein
VQQGSWQEAAELHGMLLQHATGGEWSVDTFAQELQQPISITSFTGSLNRQDDPAAAAFATFAGSLGESGVDLMHHVMVDLESARQQRILADAIVAACREHPERLAAYLGDPRPAVVRSVVQMLAAIGGKGLVGLLQSAVNHSDPRVRYEVVAAMRGVDPRQARPLLLKLVQSDDSRTFVAALLMLAERRDPQVARYALELTLGPDFEQRSNDEKRAIYSALGSAGGDELMPELEAELLKGGWFQRGNEGHRLAIARCVARIATPMAREVIEEGARSRRGPIHDLCEELLQRWEQRRG